MRFMKLTRGKFFFLFKLTFAEVSSQQKVIGYVQCRSSRIMMQWCKLKYFLFSLNHFLYYKSNLRDKNLTTIEGIPKPWGCTACFSSLVTIWREDIITLDRFQFKCIVYKTFYDGPTIAYFYPVKGNWTWAKVIQFCLTPPLSTGDIHTQCWRLKNTSTHSTLSAIDGICSISRTNWQGHIAQSFSERRLLHPFQVSLCRQNMSLSRSPPL